MTSSHHGPYGQGYTRATMGRTEGNDTARWSGTHKASLSSDWSLQLDFASNRKSECCGEYVPGPCTHRPSHHGSGLHQK